MGVLTFSRPGPATCPQISEATHSRARSRTSSCSSQVLARRSAFGQQRGFDGQAWQPIRRARDLCRPALGFPLLGPRIAPIPAELVAIGAAVAVVLPIPGDVRWRPRSVSPGAFPADQPLPRCNAGQFRGRQAGAGRCRGTCRGVTRRPSNDQEHGQRARTDRPTDATVQTHLVTEPTFEADPGQIADQQHPHGQLGIDRRGARGCCPTASAGRGFRPAGETGRPAAAGQCRERGLPDQGRRPASPVPSACPSSPNPANYPSRMDQRTCRVATGSFQ